MMTREQRNAYQQKWYQEHKEQRREQTKKYRETRKKQFRKYRRNHLQEHNEESKKYYHTFKHKIFAKLGNKCVRCGFSDIRALQIDHINGGGYKEIRGMSTSQYLKKVLTDTEGNYQLLCANCNQIKGRVFEGD